MRQVCISTIQRMYSILSGEPIDEAAEDSLAQRSATNGQAGAARRLQPDDADRVLRLHHHRRVPPQHLQPLAAGARLLRRLPDRPHRHARQPHLRLLQRKRRQRIQLRTGRGRWRQCRQRRLPDRNRNHAEGRHAQGPAVGRQSRTPDPQEALGRDRRRHRLHRQAAGPLRGQPQPDPHRHPGLEDRRGDPIFPAARKCPRR